MTNTMNDFNYFLMNVVISIIWIAIILLAVGVTCLFLSLMVSSAIGKFKSPKQEAEEWGKDNPSNIAIEPPDDLKDETRKEWGYVKLSAADELVMSTMTSYAKGDYLMNKINVFRGSDTPIKIRADYVRFEDTQRLKWSEI